jgi:uncharacterized protein YifE (UPF0438 family)
MSPWGKPRGIELLTGKTIESVNIGNADEQVIFNTTCGKKYIMEHQQDCCESVSLDDVIGDWEDILGTEILAAYESASEDLDEARRGVLTPDEQFLDKLATTPHEDPEDYESQTWTFYAIRTIKGTVTLRWYGTSNGYYSESVDFWEEKADD